MSPRSNARDSASMRRVPAVRDMMARDFPVLRPDVSVGEAARRFVRHRLRGAAVVAANGRFLGFVSLRGLLAALADFLNDERPAGPVAAILDPASPPLAEEGSLLDALQLFAEAGDADLALPVLRDGVLVGVVTRLDAVRAVMRYLGPDADTRPGTLYLSALRGPDEGPET
jgi:CBS domain-containing protein